MEEHTFVTVNGLRVKIKMSYHTYTIAWRSEQFIIRTHIANSWYCRACMF